MAATSKGQKEVRRQKRPISFMKKELALQVMRQVSLVVPFVG